MNRLAIVVEGQSDVTLLRALLRGKTDAPPRFYAAGGRASLATLARNILVHEGGPLLLVMDANTLDSSQAEMSRQLVEVALRRVAAAEAFDVFSFLPALEVVFFEAPAVLQRRFGSGAVSPSVIERGRFAPQDTIWEIVSSSSQPGDSIFKG